MNILQRYLQALFMQFAQSVACHRLHSIEQRFCRWILITRDRVHAPQFPMTHEFIAQMLGARRTGISELESALEAAGVMESRRG